MTKSQPNMANLQCRALQVYYSKNNPTRLG